MAHGPSLAKPTLASHVLLDLRRRWPKGNVLTRCCESLGTPSPHCQVSHWLLGSERSLRRSKVAVLLARVVPFMQRVTQGTHDLHTPIMTGLARLQVFIMKQSESRDASKCNMRRNAGWLGSEYHDIFWVICIAFLVHGRCMCCMGASPFLTLPGRPCRRTGHKDNIIAVIFINNDLGLARCTSHGHGRVKW